MICIPVFTSVLFPIAQKWKQPKYPSTDEFIRNCGVFVYIFKHTHTHNRVILNNKRGSLVAQMVKNLPAMQET